MSHLPPPTGPPARTSGGRGTSQPARWPAPTPVLTPAPAPAPAPHPTLPLAAGVGAIAVLTASLLLSKVVLDLVVDFRWPLLVYVTLLGTLGYGPSLIWWSYTSRRWGTGHLFDDVGLRPRWSDLGWGPIAWLCAVATQIVIGVAIVTLGIPVGNNTDGIAELSTDRTYVVSIVITAVVAAPIVEEVVFRGIVLRSLLSRLHAVAAIAVQAVLFGAAHVDPVRGVDNIGLVVVLSGVGAALGGAAYLLGRIGPTIVAHAILNAVVLTLVLTGVTERLTT